MGCLVSQKAENCLMGRMLTVSYFLFHRIVMAVDSGHGVYGAVNKILYPVVCVGKWFMA
jgi:hypothetical protein